MLSEPVPAFVREHGEQGRLMPEGLRYVSSWGDLELKRCFQLMETEDASLFAVWIEAWSDLVEFEVVPVQTSAEAASRAAEVNP